ncbi:hypothetical protein GCM10009425_28970 [Pseudomonas asuensis]|jgi:hypothetical protein|uniref:Uncharacterized protein n=1 Tax=Pseudomonas asuensis TaxID=1825787 RepID=A0ABQ2GVW9_9PSED|nr:hypothetical protein GCM10009425_28970 [Pseudomonas asuensis]
MGTLYYPAMTAKPLLAVYSLTGDPISDLPFAKKRRRLLTQHRLAKSVEAMATLVCVFMLYASLLFVQNLTQGKHLILIGSGANG